MMTLPPPTFGFYDPAYAYQFGSPSILDKPVCKHMIKYGPWSRCAAENVRISEGVGS